MHKFDKWAYNVAKQNFYELITDYIKRENFNESLAIGQICQTFVLYDILKYKALKLKNWMGV